MDIAIGAILIVAALFLIVAVLLQSGKDKKLSGAIGGTSSDTYYGKNKGSDKDAILNKLTIVVSIVFVVLVLVSFILQDDAKAKYEYEDFLNGITATETTDDKKETSDDVNGGKDTSGTTENKGSDTSATDTSAEADDEK
jgi:preprotein translocase subunit SecG